MKRRWRERANEVDWACLVWLLAVVAVCCGVLGFLALGHLLATGEPSDFDRRLLLALRDPADLKRPAGPLWLKDVGRDLSALGGATVVLTLSFLVVGYLALRRRWTRIALIVVTVAGGYALSNGLKNVYDRVRPDVVPHFTEVRSASFPSGHSMSSSLVYLTLGALLANAAERRREKIYFVAAALLLAFLIGCSRVFLGVHYPSDVLAGWSAGIAWASLCWLLAQRLGRRDGAAD